jgi:hypothetical protein
LDQRSGNVDSFKLLNLQQELDCFISQMDYWELQEIRCALQSHEDVIRGNRSLIIMAIARINERDHHVTSQIATIMGTLVQQKHQINVLEAECNMLVMSRSQE